VPRKTSPLSTPVVVGGLIVLLLLSTVGILRPLESLVGLVFRPVTGIFNGGQSGLEKENADLRQKVAELTGELVQREEAQRQVDALRTQLNFAQENKYQLAQADITSQDPANYRQFFTIDRGSTSGIKDGMVVVSGGLLVGRIIETTATTAKVHLITDYNSAVPALAQASRATGLVKGERGFGLSLDSVPQTDQLQPGDTLITSGFGGEYPRGLVIGTVGEVKRKDADVYQTATVRPAVDFRKLESVFVITGTQ
jgi:rod shape-determining protein MreC